MDFSSNVRTQNASKRTSHTEHWTIVESVTSVVALTLLISPWMFRYTEFATATWSAVIFGLLMGATTAIRAFGVANAGVWVWGTLALGACAFFAPWGVGFDEVRNAEGMHVTAGLLVITMTMIKVLVRYLDGPAGSS